MEVTGGQEVTWAMKKWSREVLEGSQQWQGREAVGSMWGATSRQRTSKCQGSGAGLSQEHL
jgi:hypothetical protein